MRGLRVATLDECLRYGHRGLYEQSLLPPIAGGASFAKIQAKGAGATTGAATVTLTSAPIQNNLLVAGVTGATATAITMSSTGWTALTSAATGTGGTTRAIRLFWKRAGASESSTVTTASIGASWGISVVEYEFGGAVLAPTENSQANGTGATQSTPAVTPTANLPALVVGYVGTRTTATWSTEQINSSATGVNTEDTEQQTNFSSAFFDLLVASTSGSYSGAATPSVTTATGVGAVAVFTLAVTAPSVVSPAQAVLRATSW